jgi:hypothetical protein
VSTLTIREIEEGEDLVIATVNDSLDSWNMASQGLGASNFREEGIDHRCLDDGAVLKAADDIDTGTAIPVNGGAAAAVLNDGTDDMVIGPFNLSVTDDEKIVVRASLYYAMATDDTEFTVDIRYGSSASGPWTQMPRTVRTHAMRTGALFPVGKGSISITTLHAVENNSTLYFALFAESGPTGADDTEVDSVTFFAEQIAR